MSGREGRAACPTRAIAVRRRHLRCAPGLNRLSRFEDATDAGERFASELELGPVPALRWRLVALRRLTRSKARILAIPEAALRNNDREPRAENPPELFSRPFAEALAVAVDSGHVSALRHAAALVALPIEGLEELFAVHRVERPRRP